MIKSIDLTSLFWCWSKLFLSTLNTRAWRNVEEEHKIEEDDSSSSPAMINLDITKQQDLEKGHLNGIKDEPNILATVAQAFEIGYIEKFFLCFGHYREVLWLTMIFRATLPFRVLFTKWVFQKLCDRDSQEIKNRNAVYSWRTFQEAKSC